MIYKNIVLLFGVFLFTCSTVSAQINHNEFYSNGFSLGGFDNDISTIFQSNSGDIYAAGNFKWYNGKAINGIARKNPNSENWEAIGEGIDLNITAIAEFDEELFAAGTINGSYSSEDVFIYKYDETQNIWVPSNQNINRPVYDLKVIGDELFSVGIFDGGIRRYNPSEATWDIVDNSFTESFQTIWTIEEHNDTLYIGGSITLSTGHMTGIAYFDLTNNRFETKGTNLGSSRVDDMKVYNGELYATGKLSKIEESGSSSFLTAKWSDTQKRWIFFDEMVHSNENSNVLGYNFEVYNEQLFVGGVFNSIGDAEGANIAFLDTSTNTWKSKDLGLYADGRSSIKSLNNISNELWIGGSFFETNPVIRNIASYYGNKLTSRVVIDESLKNGLKHFGWGLQEFNGDLIISGFGTPNSNYGHISKLSSSSGDIEPFWLSVSDYYTNDFEVIDGALYAGGGTKENQGFIAYTDQQGEWKIVDEKLDRPVDGLANVNDELVVVGSFSKTITSDTPLGSIAKYDFLNDEYIHFGEGLGSSNKVNDVFYLNGNIYAVGVNFNLEHSFVEDSPVGKFNVQKQIWEGFGEGLLDHIYHEVNDLVEYDELLVVAGRNIIQNNDLDSPTAVAYYHNQIDTWIRLGEGIYGTVNKLAVYNNVLYAGGFFDLDSADGVNIAFLDESDQTWKPLGSGVDDIVFDLEIFDSKLYIAGNFKTAGGKAASGITYYQDPNLVSNLLETGQPTKFQLHQNYPNPFNPSTSISFSIPKASHINVVVFDILGRIVSELADQRFEVGTHSLTFDASTLSSGTYIYRIEANGEVLTKKMMLIK